MMATRVQRMKSVLMSGSRRGVSLLVVGCLAVVLVAVVSAGGVGEGAQTASALVPKVSYVATGGIWENAGRYGKYRLVVVTEGVEHSGTYVYGQWLEIDESKHRLVAVATVPIDALNEKFSSVVQNVRFDYAASGDGKGVFKLILSERFPEKETQATVILRGPGDFEATVR